MTITLHWWYVPAALFLLGLFLLASDRSTGYGAGAAHAVAFLICVVSALAFALGHVLA